LPYGLSASLIRSTPFFTWCRTSFTISGRVFASTPIEPSGTPTESGYQSVRLLLVLMYRPAEIIRGPSTNPSRIASRSPTPM
jgi:hypothetical protein